MNIRLVSGVVVFMLIVNGTPAVANEPLFCNGFESCAMVDEDQIAALEARIAELERLLAGAQRGVDSGTGEDTLALSNALASPALRLGGLLNTQDVGNSLVCFDFEGNLRPCPDDYVPPTNDSLLGRWTGMKFTDPDYSGTGTCFDDEVSIDLTLVSDGIRIRVGNITTRREGVGIDISGITNTMVSSGFASGTYSPFSDYPDPITLYSIQFDALGTAFGEWTEEDDPDWPYDPCYGTYVLTRE